MIANYGNHPVRNALYQSLVFAGVKSGHSVITGKATPGATLKITKDFTLYTNPVLQPTTPASTTPPLPIPTHLESSLVVPALGPVHVGRQPVDPPGPAVPRRGPGRRPERLPAGVLDDHLHGRRRHAAGDEQDHGRQGPDGQHVALHAGRRRRHGAGHAGADARHAGHVRRVHAGRREGLHGARRRP